MICIHLYEYNLQKKIQNEHNDYLKLFVHLQKYNTP